MKSSSSSSSSGTHSTSSNNDHRTDTEDANASSEEDTCVDKRPSSVDSIDRPNSRNDESNNDDEGLRIKGTKPLDLTTKV